MKNETTKSQTPNNQPRIIPKTKIQLEEENLGFEIQINQLKNRILENRRKLLNLGSGGPSDDCVYKDFPDD